MARADKVIRVGKERSPGSGDRQQDGLDAAWPEAVEPDAEGELDDGKGEEVGRRQEPEIPRRQGELCDQRLGDQRVDGAVEIGEVVAAHERQQDEQDDAGEGCCPARVVAFGRRISGRSARRTDRDDQRGLRRR